MDKNGINPEILENIKKIYEAVPDSPIAQYNWNEIAMKFTESVKFPQIDWTAIQENFRTTSLVFSMSDEFREYVRIVKESEGLSEEEFEKKFSAEIEQSRELGRNGWIPSEYGNPRDFAEWRSYIHESPEKIMDFFEENDENVIKQIKHTLDSIYVEKPYVTYYQNGIKAFDNEEYMTAALYLTILFEIRISNLVEFPKKNVENKRLRYKDKYSSYGYSIQKNKDYESAIDFTEKRFDILNFYPALEEYTNRLFCFGNLPLDMKQESKPEPDYLDRTWLLHGRCCRETTKVDCVQLINALDVCEFIFKEIDIDAESDGMGEQHDVN